jgi:hypothetical protein
VLKIVTGAAAAGKVSTLLNAAMPIRVLAFICLPPPADLEI